MLYISARLRMHAVILSPSHTRLIDQDGGCNGVIFQAQNGGSYNELTVLRRLETNNYVFSVIHTGVAILKLVLGHVR